MTLRDAIKTLSDAGVPDAAYDARLIFSELSGQMGKIRLAKMRMLSSKL